MNRFANTVIVTDLDGTFLDEREGLVERNLKAIEYFKAHGGYFTVATGRAPVHAKKAIPDLDKIANFPAVTCNGACMYDFSAEEVPCYSAMPYGDAVELVSFIREKYPDVGIRVSSREYCFVCEEQDTKNRYISQELKKYCENNLIAPIEEWRDVTILKVVFRLDAEVLNDAMRALKERFVDRFEFTQSWPTIIDVQPRGVNKGIAIRNYVRQRLGEDAVIYACGDYFNDIEMLKEADVAVCPSNAQESVKEISDLCLCSNNDGLIADVIEYIEKQINKGGPK